MPKLTPELLKSIASNEYQDDKLDLSNEYLSEQNIQQLCVALRTNTTVKHLFLSECGITNDMVQLLTQDEKLLTRLISLDLSYNLIDGVGCLVRLLKKLTSEQESFACELSRLNGRTITVRRTREVMDIPMPNAAQNPALHQQYGQWKKDVEKASDTALVSLNISGIKMISERQLILLTKLLVVNKTLTHLGIRSNKLGSSGADTLALTQYNNKKQGGKLASLDVGSNDIGNSGAVSLGQTSLTYLNISSNRVEDLGLEKLIASPTLTTLNVSDNRITSKGLLSVLQNTTLTALIYLEGGSNFNLVTPELYSKINSRIEQNKLLAESKAKQQAQNDYKTADAKSAAAASTATATAAVPAPLVASTATAAASAPAAMAPVPSATPVATSFVLSPKAIAGLERLGELDFDEQQKLMRMVQEFQERLGQLDGDVKLANQQLKLNSVAQKEQAYIDRDPKLANYQRRLTQELTKFITAYFLASAEVFKLADNKKGMVLDVLGNLPVAGQFLKIFTVGLQQVNNEYRMYGINHLIELFSSLGEIESVMLHFTRQLTLAKENDIKGTAEFVATGTDKFFGAIKEKVMRVWHDQKVSNSNGVEFAAEEKLALLDGAFLVERVLSGNMKLDPKTKGVAVVPDLLKTVLRDPNYQYKTPAHVGSSNADSAAAETVMAAASAPSAAASRAPGPMTLIGQTRDQVADLKAQLAQQKKDFEETLERERTDRAREREVLAKLVADMKRLQQPETTVGGEQAQVYANSSQSPRGQRLSEGLHFRLQAVENHAAQLGTKAVQHDQALSQQGDDQAKIQAELTAMKKQAKSDKSCVIA